MSCPGSRMKVMPGNEKVMDCPYCGKLVDVVVYGHPDRQLHHMLDVHPAKFMDHLRNTNERPRTR